jgi:hypothetical protein
MRNHRKLSSAILAIAITLTLTPITAVPADAAYSPLNAEQATTLHDLGIYKGQDVNNPLAGLENALTTQDALIFLARLFGYVDDACRLSDDEVARSLAKFDDADSMSDYAKQIIAYSASTGILSGSTQNGRFYIGATDTVTAARFAAFMLKQMGYDVPDYKLAVEQLAETNGSRSDPDLTGELSRDSAVGLMYDALAAEKTSGKSIIADIIGDNADLRAKAEKHGLLPPPPTTDEVVVESVRALNCKQIEIVFNQEMNKGSVESEDFYEIYDHGIYRKELGDSSASLDIDRKTVIITLNMLLIN